MRVGLLGGSFNPAHRGHAHVARRARRLLGLDQVWLLVSPGNPLKPARGMAPFAERLASARRIADGRRIVATGIEAALGTQYTADTILALRRIFPNVHFVWLMGADNLLQLPRWRRWIDIARAVPIAVLPRPSYNRPALAGQAAHRLRLARLATRAATTLAARKPPAWVFLCTAQNPTSATAIRTKEKECSHRQKAPRAPRASGSAGHPPPDTGAQAGAPGAAAG
ncbi:MAG: nicotinate-nucleotide adenylyltransferase [Alphaproteobacteria bacterium]|nr:nicotinate-nucleotide adenylyltransferase [Alphaproteobacteria bacterium]